MTTTLLACGALLVAAQLAGCSSSAPPTSAVEQRASSLTGVASPGPGWSRVQAPLFAELIVGAVPVTESIEGAPVALIYDDTGTVTYATTGWTRTVAPSGVADGCREAQSWMAKAEDRYGLVSGSGDFLDLCTTFVADSTRDSLVGPSGLSAQCAPAAPPAPSTCARVDAAARTDGRLELIATVSLQ